MAIDVSVLNINNNINANNNNNNQVRTKHLAKNIKIIGKPQLRQQQQSGDQPEPKRGQQLQPDVPARQEEKASSFSSDWKSAKTGDGGHGGVGQEGGGGDGRSVG